MPTGRGSDTILGVGKESAWGTPVAVTQKVPYVNETLTDQFQEIQNPALLGVAGRAFSDQGVRNTEGGFVSMFNYQLQDIIFEQFFGQKTQIAPTANPNQYEYDLIDTTEGKSLTIAIEKNVSVWEYAGFKPSQMIITGSPTDGLRYTVNGIAKSLTVAASSPNNSGILSGLSAPPKNCLYQTLAFSIEALGTALKVVNLSGFTLTIDRLLTADEVDEQDRLEAIENGLRDVTLQIVMPRYTTVGNFLGNQFHTWHAADTKLWGKLTWTDGTKVKTFRLNKMKVVNPGGVNISGQERPSQTVDLRLFTDAENDNTDVEFDFTQELQLFEDG